MARFHLRSFDRILDDVLEARAWYASIGIRTEGTRLELIENKTLELFEDLKALPPEEVVDPRASSATRLASGIRSHPPRPPGAPSLANSSAETFG